MGLKCTVDRLFFVLFVWVCFFFQIIISGLPTFLGSYDEICMYQVIILNSIIQMTTDFHRRRNSLLLKPEGIFTWSAFTAWIKLTVDFYPVILAMGKVCSAWICKNAVKVGNRWCNQGLSQQELLTRTVLIVLAVNG